MCSVREVSPSACDLQGPRYHVGAPRLDSLQKHSPASLAVTKQRTEECVLLHGDYDLFTGESD